jgi:zearalenone synthase (nonreducing iterative type I polyketide synthase)
LLCTILHNLAKPIDPSEAYGDYLGTERHVGRAAGDTELMSVLSEPSIPAEAYPGFMEDPRLGAVGWSLAHKTDADLGPNGWDKYVGKGQLICSSIDGDHLDLPTPGFVHLHGEYMERAFDHFRGE